MIDKDSVTGRVHPICIPSRETKELLIKSYPGLLFVDEVDKIVGKFVGKNIIKERKGTNNGHRAN